MNRVADFATGKPIDISKPEELVRQEFERILHEDHGYPRECMDIEIGIQMGSSLRACDIAIYDTPKKEALIGIAEVKAPKNTTGKDQLTSYMSACPSARWGVWTNGEEIDCARKDQRTGEIEFSPAFSIPNFGETGRARIRRFSDLKPASNLKWLFRIINNRLYANTNLPRSEKQGAEMVRLIFCKLTDEYQTRGSSKPPRFQVHDGESRQDTRKRIIDLWRETRDGHLGSPIFKDNETIEIDDYSLSLIVSKLQGYSLLETDRDVVGDAFEVFSEKQFAGEKGQFFTPRAVVKMIVSMISPQKTETVLDPACGSGGFLVAALNHIAGDTSNEEKREIAEHCLFGIDKESDLSKICKAHMSIIGDGKSNIVTADSLDNPKQWEHEAQAKFTEKDGTLKQFDVIMTNPPFGSKIKVDKPEVLAQYDLAKSQGTPPQVLFIERCIRFLKPGGRMGIVLPDGILGNGQDSYIREWISRNAKVKAVVDCPTATFMPHTGTKTSVLILEKHTGPADATSPFMAIAEHCGHTFRGSVVQVGGTVKEDFSTIANNYLTKKRGGGGSDFSPSNFATAS